MPALIPPACHVVSSSRCDSATGVRLVSEFISVYDTVSVITIRVVIGRFHSFDSCCSQLFPRTGGTRWSKPRPVLARAAHFAGAPWPASPLHGVQRGLPGRPHGGSWR